jgi:hypothetical protein
MAKRLHRPNDPLPPDRPHGIIGQYRTGARAAKREIRVNGTW